VWAMRQAGRWDSEFVKIRSGLSFFEFSEDVEKSIAASLCPKRFGVDGIILFYDITTLPIAMGLPFELKKDIGPLPDRPIRTLQDLERLNPEPAPENYQHIRDLLRGVKAKLQGELPVIVFAGAPFTVATYCIGTGKDMAATRAFASGNPAVWQGLLERLNHATIGFLKTLIHEGADLYQLFDSWAGMLTPDEYEAWANRYHTSILQAATGVPRILFVKENPYLDAMANTGADVLSLGNIHDLAAAKAKYPQLIFQGNVNEEILRRGTVAEVIRETQRVMAAGAGHRHIINLNHGVGKETPPENFAAYIRTARGEATTSA
jgi:uroporphyrinogen decarboxylase